VKYSKDALEYYESLKLWLAENGIDAEEDLQQLSSILIENNPNYKHSNPNQMQANHSEYISHHESSHQSVILNKREQKQSEKFEKQLKKFKELLNNKQFINEL